MHVSSWISSKKANIHYAILNIHILVDHIMDLHSRSCQNVLATDISTLFTTGFCFFLFLFLKKINLWTLLLIFGTLNRSSCLVWYGYFFKVLWLTGTVLSFFSAVPSFLQLICEKLKQKGSLWALISFALWLARKSFQEKIMFVCFQTVF